MDQRKKQTQRATHKYWLNLQRWEVYQRKLRIISWKLQDGHWSSRRIDRCSSGIKQGLEKRRWTVLAVRRYLLGKERRNRRWVGRRKSSLHWGWRRGSLFRLNLLLIWRQRYCWIEHSQTNLWSTSCQNDRSASCQALIKRMEIFWRICCFSRVKILCFRSCQGSLKNIQVQFSKKSDGSSYFKQMNEMMIRKNFQQIKKVVGSLIYKYETSSTVKKPFSVFWNATLNEETLKDDKDVSISQHSFGKNFLLARYPRHTIRLTTWCPSCSKMKRLTLSFKLCSTRWSLRIFSVNRPISRHQYSICLRWKRKLRLRFSCRGLSPFLDQFPPLWGSQDLVRYSSWEKRWVWEVHPWQNRIWEEYLQLSLAAQAAPSEPLWSSSGRIWYHQDLSGRRLNCDHFS